MIPKIIHFIWFGRNPYSDKIQRCIDSWYKYLPEYEFKLWNEETFDIQGSCEFVRHAFEHKKWAFVSDYVRVWALKNYGGIYLDTDVEVKKSFNDLLDKQLVLGTDELGHLTALMASETHHPFWEKIISNYESMNFLNPDGSLNMTVNNLYIERELNDYGYIVANKYQELNGGIEIYPDDWFHAADHMTGIMNVTANTYAIHWHTLTWCPTSTHINRYLRIKILGKLIGKKRANELFLTLSKFK